MAAVVFTISRGFDLRLHVVLLGDVMSFDVVAVKKRLACGDEGMGAMAAPADIEREVARALVGFADREYDNR